MPDRIPGLQQQVAQRLGLASAQNGPDAGGADTTGTAHYGSDAALILDLLHRVPPPVLILPDVFEPAFWRI